MSSDDGGACLPDCLSSLHTLHDLSTGSYEEEHPECQAFSSCSIVCSALFLCMQHVPLHSTASARAAAAAIDAFHISDGHTGLGSRRGGAFGSSRENARRRMSLDNSALEPAAGWPMNGQSMEGCAAIIQQPLASTVLNCLHDLQLSGACHAVIEAGGGSRKIYHLSDLGPPAVVWKSLTVCKCCPGWR